MIQFPTLTRWAGLAVTGDRGRGEQRAGQGAGPAQPQRLAVTGDRGRQTLATVRTLIFGVSCFLLGIFCIFSKSKSSPHNRSRTLESHQITFLDLRWRGLLLELVADQAEHLL